MKVGFLVNQLDLRGTGNAVRNYAKYNESILGNESFIFTPVFGNHDAEALISFQNTPIFDTWLASEFDLDVLYHIKSGFYDGFKPKVGRYVVHAVFDYQPHGDRYAMISEWLGKKYGAKWVPHIINLSNHTDDYRHALGIPADAFVFGRHGASDTFDISFVWNAIKQALEVDRDVHFVFLNTDKPNWEHERVHFLPKTASDYEKRKFLNTCDAMIHARIRGETFGISVGEFAVLNKPVITYAHSPEQAHIEQLQERGFLYEDEKSLLERLLTLSNFDLYIAKTAPSDYDNYTPKKVMAQFQEVFLS